MLPDQMPEFPFKGKLLGNTEILVPGRREIVHHHLFLGLQLDIKLRCPGCVLLQCLRADSFTHFEENMRHSSINREHIGTSCNGTFTVVP